MPKYYYVNNTFVIEDYQEAKTFANFLPAIAGVDGKPLWAFYANVGQAMGGFGVSNKDTPITPFDSAITAYQNIPIKSFRTFIKSKKERFTPFFGSDKDAKRTMMIDRCKLTIIEEHRYYRYEIVYSTVSHKNYAGLLRKVTLVNTSDKTRRFDVVDGLPIFFPHGLSNSSYKELVSLMSAYCVVKNTINKTPFVKFKTSTNDNAIVSESLTGNGFITIDESNRRLDVIVDPYKVFDSDSSWIEANNFFDLDYKDFIKLDQQVENKLPSAFSTFSKRLKANESYSFISVYGMFENEVIFKDMIKSSDYQSLDKEFLNTDELIESLVEPMGIHTTSEIFDLYAKQSFFDNGLRGGFPILLNDNLKGKVYYAYGRKHGDMERDYNSFQIPSKYYSSGTGNFRDVNQNRRSDLYFFPFVEDFNIKLFFNLIQADGQNPLNVKQILYHFDQNYLDLVAKRLKGNLKKKVLSILNSYEPSLIYTLLKDNAKMVEGDYDELLATILEHSSYSFEANFSEGYWVDHWTYNVDLLENYASVYPDKIRTLLLDNSYQYFYSPVFVEPRSEKYCLREDKKIRQYGAIDLQKLAKVCEDKHFDIKSTSWLKDSQGNIVKTSLASKIFNLILIKFSTLDSLQLGIEMECEKPGWNDAMNGLPGLFGSGMGETIELLRLVNFARKYFTLINEEKIKILKEQNDLYQSVKINLDELMSTSFKNRMRYYDEVTTARERYRLSISENCSGEESIIKVESVLKTLEKMSDILNMAISRAKELGKGIIPTYLYYEVTEYEKLKTHTHLGYQAVKAKKYELKMIPQFLEGSARLYKLGKEYMSHEDHELIKKSDLYDKELRIYKTCADLDDTIFEIGRIHAFTKGWLERECDFLHMSYKYLLGLLKAGLYEDFYEEIKTNMVCFMKPEVYGRSIIENSSFIVPTCNPDKKIHGQGFFARLTGANAEMINILNLMFVGDNVFELREGVLTLALNPKLCAELFDDNNEVRYRIFDKTDLIYHNPNRLNTYDEVKMTYKIGEKDYKVIDGQLAKDIRQGKIERIDIYIGK